MSVYENVKKKCEEKRISIAALEEAAELSNGAVSKWKGEKMPKLDTIYNVAKILNTDIEYFLTGAERITDYKSLSESDHELLDNFHKLDRRAQHHIQLKIYDELDRMEKETRLRAGESYESVFGPSQEEPRPTRPPSKIPRIPFVAKGDDKISEEDDQMIQEKLRAMEERSRMIREKREE